MVRPTIRAAQMSNGNGLSIRARMLAIIDVTASWLRSSIRGIDTTLTANTSKAKMKPTPK